MFLEDITHFTTPGFDGLEVEAAHRRYPERAGIMDSLSGGLGRAHSVTNLLRYVNSLQRQNGSELLANEVLHTIDFDRAMTGDAVPLDAELVAFLLVFDSPWRPAIRRSGRRPRRPKSSR